MNIEMQNSIVQHYYSYFTGPQNIMLDVTQKCNFRCKHCYNESCSTFNDDLDDESMLKIVDQIIEVNPVLVCLCGGEPTMRFELVLKIARKLTRAGIPVNMVSNGYLLSIDRLKKLYSSGIVSIQISLDSYKKYVVDNFRCHEGAFEGAIKAIDNILSLNQTPVVSYIPTKLNFRDIGGVAKLLHDKGIKSLRYMPLVPIGRGNRNLDSLLMNASDYMEMYGIISKYQKLLPDFEFTYGDPLEHIYLFRTNPEAVNAAYEIKSNGDILLSSYLPYTYGNVINYSLRELWDIGLKDIWKRKDFRNLLMKINTLEDIGSQENFPYRNEDIDLLKTEVETV